MKAGDTVCLKGYELMAVIDYIGGPAKAVVVHNNSTHILLFRVNIDEATQHELLMEGVGIHIAAWRYFPDGWRYFPDGRRCNDSYDFNVAYKLALTQATGMATGELSDGT